jgi:arginine decarboxylase
MDNLYSTLINQTFNFPQESFEVKDEELYFNDIPLMDVIKQYGTPLRITYLPKISSQIQKAKRLFNVAMAKVDYKRKVYLLLLYKEFTFQFCAG